MRAKAGGGKPGKGRAFNPPKIFPEDRLYLDAWQELTTTRPPSVAGAKSVTRYTISWLAIHKWAAVNSVDVRILSRAIWQIDKIYLEWVGERDEMARANDNAAILGPNGRPL